MNLICPLCGAKNQAIEIWHDPDELNYDRVYCCLSTVGGNTRCEALFTVTLHGDHLERGLTEAELAKLPPRPRVVQEQQRQHRPTPIGYIAAWPMPDGGWGFGRAFPTEAQARGDVEQWVHPDEYTLVTLFLGVETKGE